MAEDKSRAKFKAGLREWRGRKRLSESKESQDKIFQDIVQSVDRVSTMKAEAKKLRAKVEALKDLALQTLNPTNDPKVMRSDLMYGAGQVTDDFLDAVSALEKSVDKLENAYDYMNSWFMKRRA